MTQAELAAGAGLHVNTVRYWERQEWIGQIEEGAVQTLVATLRRCGIEVSFTMTAIGDEAIIRSI
jgi:hypothetical protein